ncbi:MAG: hypothetical protein B0D92_05765 [Spirochaeta sp. LUC14_002_19_P3]|nr:MAG: hypothetical protein B0D92_05765 [Spirochaeta sp. LUC14_002_19_P3]
MMMYIILLVVLLILSSLFSSMETAYTSLTPGQINALAEKGKRPGRLVRKLTEQPHILLTTLLIGNNLANLGASALTTAMTMKLFGEPYIAATTGVLTLLVLIFCEVSPKQIALTANETLCLRSAQTILILSWLLRPVIWIITAISRTLTYLAVGRTKRVLSREVLLHHVKAAGHEGVVKSYEEEMIRNVFRISGIPVKAIMTHRTELFTVTNETPVRKALEYLLKSRHSRMPVIKSGTEHVCGVISLVDIAAALEENADSPVEQYAASPCLVPGSMKVHELFLKFRNEPIHLAIILDEYGGLNGIVTREDIMEEIFGNLYDERDNLFPEEICADGNGGWIAQGTADFYTISDKLGVNLEHDSNIHTLGGYLLEKLGHIPEPGTAIDLPEGCYVILNTHKKRILTVRFVPKEDKSKF